MSNEIPFFGSYSPVSLAAASGARTTLEALCAQPVIRAVLEEHHPDLLADARVLCRELKHQLAEGEAVGVESVELGCDQSLDEPGPLILRMAASSTAHGRLDHYYLRLDSEAPTHLANGRDTPPADHGSEQRSLASRLRRIAALASREGNPEPTARQRHGAPGSALARTQPAASSGEEPDAPGAALDLVTSTGTSERALPLERPRVGVQRSEIGDALMIEITTQTYPRPAVNASRRTRVRVYLDDALMCPGSSDDADSSRDAR